MQKELLESFKNELENQLNNYSIEPNDVVKQIEFAHDSEYFSSMLLHDKTNFIKAIKDLLEKKSLKKIAVYPCNTYIEQIIEIFSEYELFVCDDYKKEETINGYDIYSTDIIEKEDFDLVLIISYRDIVRDNLMEKISPNKNIFWIYDVVKRYIAQDTDIYRKLVLKNNDFEKVDAILEKINSSKNPLIALNGFLFNNYGPTYKALENKGYEPFIIARNNHLCYAKPDSQISEFPVKNVYKLELLEIIYLCSRMKNAKVLINDISFLIPSFDANKAIVNFSFVLVLLKVLKVPKFLYLYDVIHSVMKNHKDTDEYFEIYKKVLSSANGLICNSNTPEVHNSIKYALGVDKPMLSFYRYNEYVPKLKDKIDDGEFHMVIIGGMDDKLRDSTSMLKKILAQKVHVHNYVNNNAIDEFLQILTEEEKRYFHRHESIVSQYDLIEEISQYHAGWIMDNGFEVLNMINSAENLQFKEMLMMFRLTTISSSLLAVASAGLPMFLNKMVVHVTYKFPKEFFISIEEPEIDNFSKIIKEINWDSLYSVTQKKRELFSIGKNIDTLVNWLEKQNDTK